MNIPYFYAPNLVASDEMIVLNEDTSRHIAQVLRMQHGEKIRLTNGKGLIMTAIITDNHKKHCRVQKEEAVMFPPPEKKAAIAISLLKNTSRFEWFLEKAAETGISQIIPLKCKRTEKNHFRIDRMQSILTSAMLQSQQCWLSELVEPMHFADFMDQCTYSGKYIAHCEATEKKTLKSTIDLYDENIIMIGPEGDFTPEEISYALSKNFQPVSLGATRLRTETAGMAAAVLMQIR